MVRTNDNRRNGVTVPEEGKASTIALPRPRSRRRLRAGTTLVEVLVAASLVLLLGAGLIALGLSARRLAEYSRVATEARSLGRERLEAMVSLGKENLALSSCSLLNADTNASSSGYPIVRRTRVVLHGGDGSVVGISSNAYAEIHVDVVFPSVLSKRQATNTYSMLLE